MKVRKIRKRAQLRMRKNKCFLWGVDHVIETMCSASAKMSYALSKIYAKSRESMQHDRTL